MKRLFIIVTMLAATFTSYSQSLGYQDLGVLFSQNDNNGTARFTAMSGAFGALGGDISSININPAGLSVFNNSLFTGTFNSRSTEIKSNYFGNTIITQNEFVNLSQAGAVLVFDSPYSSDWSKFAIGFNYRITKDFNENLQARGNSNEPTFREFPLDNNDPTLNYDIADEQIFNNTYGGELSELNIGFSSVHQQKLHVGLGLNFYDLNFSQQANLTEFNSDINSNELDANLYQETFITGTGFSANAGFIYKAHQSFRFGLAYQTPTWFTEIIDKNNIVDNEGFYGDTEISVSNDNITYNNTSGGYFPYQQLFYQLKTPSKLTASAALIFGKFGLLSFDYSTKNYKNIQFSGNDIQSGGLSFEDNLRNTYSINVGSELRFDKLSLRGGYKYEQSPDITALETDNLEGYSIGGGYNFGNFKLDFSYSDNNRTAAYDFYSGFDIDNSATNLNLDNKVFTATLTLSL